MFWSGRTRLIKASLWHCKVLRQLAWKKDHETCLHDLRGLEGRLVFNKLKIPVPAAFGCAGPHSSSREGQGAVHEPRAGEREIASQIHQASDTI